jgi:hypothetical protein
MAGLVPAIYVFLAAATPGMDAQVQLGRDERTPDGQIT